MNEVEEGPTASAVMSAERTPSVSSVSLLEIKEDTRLVLKAFLRHSLSTPAAERPGRVGGGYRDHTKYSANVPDGRRRPKDPSNLQEDESGSQIEKRSSLKDIIKRLQPRPSTLRRPAKDGSEQPQKGSLERDGPNGTSPGISRLRETEFTSPSSTSEEEGGENKQQKKKKKKKLRISSFFKKKEKKEEEPQPKRPTTLPINPEPVPPILTPSHPPEFYEEVAETLGRIAQKSQKIKRPSPNQPSPVITPLKLSPVRDKEEVVRQLVQVLSMEGDAINTKIESDQFLRSTLTRLSYPSFAKLLDTFASQAEAPPLPAPASPTLRRVAVTMEVSRRVVTATGTQRMQGYAERYMENFAPWVKSQGGWESIVQLEEILEYD